MKKRLNIITALLIIAAGLHMFSIWEEESFDFKSGFKEGTKSSRQDHGLDDSPKTHHLYLTLLPKGSSEMIDSVFNTKTSSWIPARMLQTVVEVPDHKIFAWDILFIFPVLLILLPAFFTILIVFIKIVSAVNKSIIFDWINVRRLRIIGIAFIAIFIVNSTYRFYLDRVADLLIEIPGYKIITSNAFNASTLILGLVCFLIAEIFSVGLKLKEDQDLTI